MPIKEGFWPRWARLHQAFHHGHITQTEFNAELDRLNGYKLHDVLRTMKGQK